MKIRKTTYFSLLLLSCFLISTTLSIVFSYSVASDSVSTSLKHQTVSSSNNGLNITSNFNLAQAENEDGNDLDNAFTTQEFVIPFIFSFSGIEASHPVAYRHIELLTTEVNPIYIAIHNFRI